MPDQMIPRSTVRLSPLRYVLPAGTELWRVHNAQWGATQFKAVPADLHWGGGRFCDIPDGLRSGKVPYLYAAKSPLTALCETLARDLEMPDNGRRRITQRKIRGTLLSKVIVAADLPLIDLTQAEGLTAVHQDHWLVTSSARHYARTRRWGSWIRSQASWATGFRWPSRQDFGPHTADAYVLYEDEDGPDLLKPSAEDSLELNSPEGRDYVNSLLEPLKIRVETPRKRT
ncbi:RES family NAD+ phosphorylase [Streptomyces sp. NPDC018338]|uniref:RES family NAD+ phosphorylase n=1 Tax=Streptomyces sp. NPDC018338 TaxID=3157192 RepID=UPI003407A0DF